MRIFQGVTGQAGQPGAIAKGLRALGAVADAGSIAKHKFGYEADFHISLDKPKSLERFFASVNALAANYDVFHFHARTLANNWPHQVYPAMLDLLASDLASCQGMVSFNGRSFDWPLIEARYVLARREPPCEAEPHLDLLRLSRGLWSRVLSSCALCSLESTVLGVERSGGDVPGYQVPQLYQNYVELGRTHWLDRSSYYLRWACDQHRSADDCD